MRAATNGQKIMSALTDRPGINCMPVKLPIHQKGTASANAGAKNVSGQRVFTAVSCPTTSAPVA